MTPTIASLSLYPVLSASSPGLPAYNPALPIQLWQAPSGSGQYSYPCLNPQTGALMLNTIPASQASQANVPPLTLPPGETTNNNVTPPPIDMTAYNALASQGLQIVATPFGLELEQVAQPAPPSGSQAALIAQAITLLQQAQALSQG